VREAFTCGRKISKGLRALDESWEGVSFLSNSEHRNRAINKFSKSDSREIRALLGESVLRRPSSVGLSWKNFAIERRTSLPCEKPEFLSENHFLILWRSYVAEGEIADHSSRFGSGANREVRPVRVALVM
jgi:hypothetical protein